jgi:AbrB family looped-hinge helix DNA binding protein
MKSATVTSKGQVTIPKEIRDFLSIKSGDLIDFVIDQDGKVVVRASTVHVGELKGLLKRPGRKPVTLEEMDRAILRQHRKRR